MAEEPAKAAPAPPLPRGPSSTGGPALPRPPMLRLREKAAGSVGGASTREGVARASSAPWTWAWWAWTWPAPLVRSRDTDRCMRATPEDRRRRAEPGGRATALSSAAPTPSGPDVPKNENRVVEDGAEDSCGVVVMVVVVGGGFRRKETRGGGAAHT